MEELILQCLILGKPGLDSTFPGFYPTVGQWSCWWECGAKVGDLQLLLCYRRAGEVVYPDIYSFIRIEALKAGVGSSTGFSQPPEQGGVGPKGRREVRGVGVPVPFFTVSLWLPRRKRTTTAVLACPSRSLPRSRRWSPRKNGSVTAKDWSVVALKPSHSSLGSVAAGEGRGFSWQRG